MLAWKLRDDLHGHFNRGQLAGGIGDHADLGDVADIDALQADGSAFAQTAGIVEIGDGE